MRQNNVMGSLMSLIAQAGNNPQAFADNLVKQNPQFAQAIQGQNLEQMTMQELQRRGINPQQIMQLFKR